MGLSFRNGSSKKLYFLIDSQNNFLKKKKDFLVYLPITKQRLSSKTVESLRDIKWAFFAFSVLTATLVGMKRTTEVYYPIGVNKYFCSISSF